MARSMVTVSLSTKRAKQFTNANGLMTDNKEKEKLHGIMDTVHILAHSNKEGRLERVSFLMVPAISMMVTSLMVVSMERASITSLIRARLMKVTLRIIKCMAKVRCLGLIRASMKGISKIIKLTETVLNTWPMETNTRVSSRMI